MQQFVAAFNDVLKTLNDLRGQTLSDEQILSHLNILLVAGHEAVARLIADGLKPKRRAAPATLPSLSTASRVINKFKSGRFIRIR